MNYYTSGDTGVAFQGFFPNVVKQASRQEIRILQNLASISSGGAQVYFVLNYYSATYLDRYLTL